MRNTHDVGKEKEYQKAEPSGEKLKEQAVDLWHSVLLGFHELSCQVITNLVLFVSIAGAKK